MEIVKVFRHCHCLSFQIATYISQKISFRKSSKYICDAEVLEQRYSSPVQKVTEAWELRSFGLTGIPQIHLAANKHRK